MEPYDFLEKVNSLETFLEFIQALMPDKRDEDEKEKKTPSSPYDSGQNGWENNDIASFLESMHTGTKDTGFSEEASWKNFAKMIYLGKIYE